MSNYLRKTDIIKKKTVLRDYSLSNNNIDDEYTEILRGMSIDKITELINKYPDYKYRKLIESIKTEFKIKNVILGCGSEDLIIRTNLLLRSKGKIAILLPNFYRTFETAGNYKKIYSHYKTESNIIDLEEISIPRNIKSIWISNPNPMNGKMYNKEQLSRLINKYHEIIFIIDESTIDFIEDSNKYSLMSLAQKIDNIIIIRSFSKLYGTAGLRVGFATGK
jgi:histidinol-phosphate/aromatic aminotransferase/cobyric acid decarboxylase-like protein